MVRCPDDIHETQHETQRWTLRPTHLERDDAEVLPVGRVEHAERVLQERRAPRVRDGGPEAHQGDAFRLSPAPLGGREKAQRPCLGLELRKVLHILPHRRVVPACDVWVCGCWCLVREV